ncbi:MAG: hypothetical protein KatS3mg085_603 [Candidatus Dojkabacteria bacterium]|nr:MAG: hypothetical protein KatS3mg085_603 [Candidatus Dojkabacteria bacterium]
MQVNLFVCGEEKVNHSEQAFSAACGSPGSGGTPNPKCVTSSGIAVPNGYIECYTNSTLKKGRQCGPNGWIENVEADACGARAGTAINDTTIFKGCGPISGYTIIRRDEGNLPDTCYNCYDYEDGDDDQTNNRKECYFEGSSCGARIECYKPTFTQNPPITEPPSTEPPPPPQSDAQCGDSCTSDSDCVSSNNVCDNGVCKLNICASNPSACNPDLCSIAPTNQVGSVSGTAYCEDNPGTRYPIANSFVTLTLSNGSQTIVQTDSNGNYTFNNLDNPNDTTAPYVVSVSHSLPQGSLSNGQPFSLLNGPNAVNCSNTSLTGCSADSCGNSNETYNMCELNDGENGTNFDFAYTNCEPIANACIGLNEIGPDPVDSGAGNIMIYVLEYQSAQATNPFPNIRLRVGPSASPVGRDSNNPSSNLVAPASTSYNSSTGIWTYYFEWEVAETDNSDVLDGSYDVRVITDGVSAEISDSSCIEQIVVTQGTVQEPVFNIVKESADICLSDGSAQIDYTIRVTNIGPVSGVIDYVEDTFDPDLVQYGITPTAISPSFGVVSGNTIRWEGSVSDRTFASNQSRTYTYRVVIPQNRLVYFTMGVDNEVELSFTTDETNTLTFSLNTPVQCTIPGIPDTSISDSRLLLVGMMFIIVGLIVYKTGFGSMYIEKLINSGIEVTDKKITKLMPFEERLQKEARKRR